MVVDIAELGNNSTPGSGYPNQLDHSITPPGSLADSRIKKTSHHREDTDNRHHNQQIDEHKVPHVRDTHLLQPYMFCLFGIMRTFIVTFLAKVSPKIQVPWTAKTIR